LTAETDTTPDCTDSFAVTGQTGKNPPSICGTNTGYHMYAEVGESSSDTATVTITYGDTSAKQYNILVRQIACDAEWRAPVDCVQWYTGRSDTIQTYNWQSSQITRALDYRICIRDAEGYCSVTYSETSGTTIDAFSLLNPAAAGPAGESTTGVCLGGGSGLFIPEVSSDGIHGFNPVLVIEAFPTSFCGGVFGIDGATSSSAALTSARKPFELGVFTGPAATIAAGSTGFSLDYAQNAC